MALRAAVPTALIGLILAANRVGRIVSAPFVGAAADRVGARPLLLLGLVLQMVVMAFYVLGVTTSRPALFFLLGRLLHGPGTASVFVATQALALRSAGREQAGKSAGIVRAAMAIGLPVGVALGGPVSSCLGNAGALEVASLALSMALAVAYRLAPRQRVVVTKRGALRDAIRLLHSSRASIRRLAALGALNFAVTFSTLGIVLTTLVLVIGARHVVLADLDARTTASALMGTMVLSMGVGTLVASRMAQSDRALALVASIGTTGLVLATTLIGIASDLSVLVTGLVVLGFSAGASSSALTVLAGRFARDEHVGSAIGFLQLAGDLGGVAGPLIAALLLAWGASAAYLGGAAFLLFFVPALLRSDRRLDRQEPAQPSMSLGGTTLTRVTWRLGAARGAWTHGA